MSDISLLNRMKDGKTQNCNESFNNLIWVRCPKTMFFGKQRIDAAVSRAVLSFNQGAQALSTLMNRLHLEVTEITMNSLSSTDRKRVKKADDKSQADAKKRRKADKHQKLLERQVADADEEDQYGAGIAD